MIADLESGNSNDLLAKDGITDWTTVSVSSIPEDFADSGAE